MATLVEALDENRKYKEEIKQLTIKVNTLEKDNMITKKELRYVKESANRYELSARSLTVRILGLPVSQEEATSSERNKVAVKNVYDRFLKPIFNSARAKGHITAVPQLTTAISEGFRLNTNAKDKRGILTLPLSSSSSQTRPTAQPSFSAKGRFWPLSRRRVVPFPSSWRT
jgi:hypothetical protein